MIRVRMDRTTVGGVTLVARHLTISVATGRWAWVGTYSHPWGVEAGPSPARPLRIHDHVLYLKVAGLILTIAALVRRSRS